MTLSLTRRTAALAIAMVTTAGLLAAGLHAPATAAVPALKLQVIASGLSYPWDLTWVNGLMLFDERPGKVWSKRGSAKPKRVTMTGQPRVFAQSEGGLLGLVADPKAATNKRFYTCQSTARSNGKPLDVRVLRWQLTSDTAAKLTGTLVAGIPVGVGTASPGRHNGCRLRFGPDGMLYIGTGDAAIGTAPQSLQSLGGKVLRVNPDPRRPVIPTDNPFYRQGKNARYVWTYGHRNIQGLALRPGTTQLWSVEHGPGKDDEINLLVKGANYGWNPVPAGGGSGYNEAVPMTDLAEFPAARRAVWSSGAGGTIAPSGGTFLTGDAWGQQQGAMVIGVLKGKEIMALQLDAGSRKAAFFRLLDGSKTGYNRIRAVQQGPDGGLYFTTSNGGGKDKIVRIAARPSRTPQVYRAGLDVSPVGVSIARTGSQFYVFIRSTGNQVYYRRSTDNGVRWGAWTSTGITSTSAPSATSSASGRIDLVTRDADRSARHTWFIDGRRAGQVDLGGDLNAAPVISSVGDGSLDVFVRRAGDMASRRHYDGSRWSGWRSLQGHFTSALGASANTTTKKTVVSGRGTNGVAYEMIVTPTGRGQWKRSVPRIWTARALGDTSGSRRMVSVSGGIDSSPVVRVGSLALGINTTYTSAPDIATRADGSWIMVGRRSDGAVWMYDARAGQFRHVSLGGSAR